MKVAYMIDFSKCFGEPGFEVKYKILPYKIQIRKKKKERIKNLKRWSRNSNANYDFVFTSKRDRKKTLRELINFKFYKN